MKKPSSPRVEHDAVHDDLRRRIVHLDLPPGTRLREQTLAAEYGISRTPIRRVLERLSFEGLVTLQPGSGATVSTVDLQYLREVWALRLKIAELVAGFVRLPAPPDILAELDRQLERLDSIDTGDELVPLYDEFHRTMLQVMTNGPLRSIHDQLYFQTARVWVQMLPDLDLDDEIEAVRDEITASRDACTRRSGEPLCEVRRKHMQMLLERLNLSLSPNLGD